VGSGRVERTEPNIFSADDAADVGVDEGTNVSAAYNQHGNQFTGKIEKVLVEVK
jgi:arylsulfatase